MLALGWKGYSKNLETNPKNLCSLGLLLDHFAFYCIQKTFTALNLLLNFLFLLLYPKKPLFSWPFVRIFCFLLFSKGLCSLKSFVKSAFLSLSLPFFLSAFLSPAAIVFEVLVSRNEWITSLFQTKPNLSPIINNPKMDTSSLLFYAAHKLNQTTNLDLFINVN